MGTRNRVMALVVVGSVAAVLLPLATRSTSALFNSSASASASATTKRIFPGNRTVIAHTAKDASSGAEFDWSDQFATADGIYYTSSSWGTAYSPTNFIDVDFDAPNPAGIPTTAVSFNLTFADARGQSGDQLCYYFDVRRSSNPTTAIATYGGGSFVACEANSVLTPSTTSILSAVPNTDVANDLRVRLYFKQSKGGVAAKIDMMTVTLTTANGSRTQYAAHIVDQGSAAPTWALSAAGDGSTIIPTSKWPGSYNTSNYMKWTFPASVPAGAVVTGATLRHSYHSDSSATLCNYFEVYNGATLIGTHGGGSFVSCNSSASTNTNDSVSLPEINTVALANNVTVKLYYKSSGKSLDDLVALDVNYYLD